MMEEKNKTAREQIDLIYKTVGIVQVLMGAVLFASLGVVGLYFNMSTRITLLEERLINLSGRVTELKVEIERMNNDAQERYSRN